MTKQLITIALIFVAGCGWSGDDGAENEQELEYEADTVSIETEVEQIEVPKTEEVKEIQKKLSLESVFLDLGCCEDETKREMACCCEKVLERYAELHTKGDAKLAEYNMKDPILGKCKRLLQAKFDKIDFPPETEGSEDDMDSLFD